MYGIIEINRKLRSERLVRRFETLADAKKYAKKYKSLDRYLHPRTTTAQDLKWMYDEGNFGINFADDHKNLDYVLKFLPPAGYKSSPWQPKRSVRRV